jgi:hypothetical protein
MSARRFKAPKPVKKSELNAAIAALLVEIQKILPEDNAAVVELKKLTESQ